MADSGWYFDDFEAGQVHTTMGRTVTEADLVNFVTFGACSTRTTSESCRTRRPGCSNVGRRDQRPGRGVGQAVVG
jgi:hypothetical protein